MNSKPMWNMDHTLKDQYDIVIIGGGGHGLAIAYYLAEAGIKNIAVLEKSYIGAGGSGRNTAIVRSNYRTPEGISFYNESLKLYEQLSKKLNINLMFAQRGHLTLAHSDRSVNGMRERAANNRLLNIDSRVVYPNEIKEIAPYLDVSKHPRYPILAALYHPPGGIIRHDAVVWGYGRGADSMGVEIHPKTEVTAINVENDKVTGVKTNRGHINCGTVVNATAGWSSVISAMAGVRMPITTHPLQALVSEPLKPFLHTIIVSSNLHVYVSQTDRGELVIGAGIEEYTTYSQRSTLPFMESASSHLLELMPMLHNVKVLRQWAGLCDMTPDYSPIMGTVDEVEGFIVDCGWGTYGFKAIPISGYTIAKLIETGKTPDLIKPFALSRFPNLTLAGEKAAASVSH